MYDVLPPHSRPRPVLPAANRARFRDAVPPHTPLASPLWDPGSSARMNQNALPSVPSGSTPLHCTNAGALIGPLEPLARRLEAWLTLPSRFVGSHAQFDSAMQFSSPGDLPSYAAEREGCLQAEVGIHWIVVRAVPLGGKGSLHSECCLILCVGARRLSGRHL